MRQMLTDNTELRLDLEELRKNVLNNTESIEVVFRYFDELLETKDHVTEREAIGFKQKGVKK